MSKNSKSSHTQGRFKAIMKVVILIGVIILPIIYSLCYLSAFWDPYGHLDEIPVALVNNDDCSGADCKGAELVKAIKDDGSFKFSETDDKDADEGLVNKKYYAEIKIPEDFTEKLSNAASRDRQTVEIYYSPNVKSSYMVMMFTRTAVNQIVAKLNLNVAATAISTLTDSITDTYNSTKQLSNGLATIQSGSNALSNGANTLSPGANTLAGSYTALNSGIYTAYQGSTKLSNGLNTLKTSVENSINTTLTDSQISAIATQAASTATSDSQISTEAVSAQVDSLIKPTDIAKAAALQVIMNQIPDQAAATATLVTILQPSSNCADLARVPSPYQTTATQICAVYNTAAAVATQISAGLKASLPDTLQSVASQAASATATTVASAIKSELISSLQQMDSAISQLSDGSNALASGLKTLSDGSAVVDQSLYQLADGANRLASGSGELSAGITTAKTALDDKLAESSEAVDNLDGLADYAKESVKANQDNYGDTDKYGIFFAPYFMSLSVWIGGIMLMVGIYYDPKHRFKVLDENSAHPILRTFLYFGLSALQGLVLAFLLKLCLGFTVTNILLYYTSFALVSAAFMSVIIFLFLAFADFGKFASLVLLVVQLAACGAVFPIETEPAFFRALQPFMPMTYSVNLFRESLVLQNGDFIASNSLTLLGILVVFGALVIIIDRYLAHKVKNSH